MKLGNFIEMQKELDKFVEESKQLTYDSKAMMAFMTCGMFSEMKEADDAIQDYAVTRDRQHALEEIIDVFHFMLSVAHRSGLDAFLSDIEPTDISPIKKDWYLSGIRLMDQIRFYKVWSVKPMRIDEYASESWVLLFGIVMAKVDSLGYTWADAEEMYKTKYEINKERQRNGY